MLKPYQFKENAWQQIKDIDFLNIIGVGDISSTPGELNIFIENLFKYKIVSKESLGIMMPDASAETWGRGLARWDFDGTEFYGHGGDAIGSHAVVIHNIDGDVSISYNTNGERIRKEEFIKNIVSSMFDKPFKLPEIK